MNQSKRPLYDALVSFSNEAPISFHVPGHKNGTVFSNDAQSLYRSLLAIDVTELSGLDDLHNPTGIIKEAEDLACNLFKSKHCFFLVGGSTVGNLAMIMATCHQGDTVLVQRNSHKSVLNGLRLAKVNPVFIEPSFDHNAQVATCIDEASLIETIKKYPNSRALIITRPNYYGYTNQIDRVVQVAHEHNIVVLVDEAHGAHFGHPSNLLPNSAIHYGADLVVQSAHKTLPAMTMGSFLHFNSGIVDINKVRHYLQLFQSSSPSYPLLASLDLARYFLAELSETELKDTLASIKLFKSHLSNIPQLKVVENAEYDMDPLKVTVQSSCELSGYQLQKLLEEEAIYTELADQNNVLFVMPLIIKNDLQGVCQRIKNKLKNLAVVNAKAKVTPKIINKTSSLALTYEEMEVLEVETVRLENSIGRIVSEAIIPYPPGIPLLISGEKIENKHIDELIELKQAGAYFQGTNIFDEGLKVFKYR
ncbi:aminotransferase class I/II-fold pyridoxal phosphate-dependent enzyme [Anaerobacillus alkaliphilus]|uniref:Aminotransferase class I/II-fold pyridoxal phosphate-dependent enzyme n=1 Tax=Anaerobacillus alkaliphilus TaxID=1548597 RepID=A0A4Q0VSG9_9BACI|nr:aminotransferase class I/II-fold pyridoxal phosphate-dependent enzyme [Anaerobacillus alkaliphilus]RXJ00887.1 aminotransferase class I/II-fold pyridoxal phosphate-dependent enzyme [Anaerobacillus alkaliphilus]